VAGAHLIRRVEPVYPEPARQQFIQGEVTLEAVIGQDGSVEVLKLLSGDPELASSAADAVRQWRFRPYEQQGKAVPFSTRLSVNFRLH
jgi:protein TonB